MKPTALPTDTAMQATLLANLMRARKVSSCALCAEPRKVVETDEGRFIVCPRCGDCAEAVR